MSIEERKTNHPLLAYIIGAIFLALSIVVAAGVFYHLTLSHHGPGLLRPLVKRHHPPESPILSEAKRQAEVVHRSHFHNVVASPRPSEADFPLCFICHAEMPHNKNKKVRALLNMHTQFLVCESCHLRPPEDGWIVYKWANPADSNPKGPFMGTRYEGETGMISEVDDKLSKITPFHVALRHGESSTVLNQDAPLARDFMRVRDRLTPAQREGVKNKFHRNVQPKGYDCQTCHRQKGLFDYAKLGFGPKRIADLEHLNITGMLTKYEVFYLPDLLSDKPGGGEPMYGEEPKP